MGIIGDIINLPIRLIKIPFKIMALPVRIPMHILFGSKKDRLEKERAKEKEDIEKERKQIQDSAPKAIPFFMSGRPDDLENVCKHLPPNLQDEKVKAICALAKKGGARRSRRVKRSGRRKTFKKILRKK